ncbi:transcriptional regulator, partial [Streptomyces sp. GC420]|nr:transcriptional regulator [Streptomyces sp. GC420]
PDLTAPRPTDAFRAHWFALPLLRALEPHAPSGVVDVRLDEGEFHVRTAADGRPAYGHGPAPQADARLVMDADTCRAVGEGSLSLEAAVKEGRVEVLGDGPVASALRGRSSTCTV